MPTDRHSTGVCDGPERIGATVQRERQPFNDNIPKMRSDAKSDVRAGDVFRAESMRITRS
jgi:hypothetical protein